MNTPGTVTFEEAANDPVVARFARWYQRWLRETNPGLVVHLVGEEERMEDVVPPPLPREVERGLVDPGDVDSGR
jgi:hypothetical protein